MSYGILNWTHRGECGKIDVSNFCEGGGYTVDWLELLQAVNKGVAVFLSVCYFYHILYLILPWLKKNRQQKEGKLHRFAILIAARNEEAVLPHLLESIRAQDYPAELLTVYVVADNCSDATAQIARDHSARVFTRFNREKVGKGYALHDLLEFIRQSGEMDSFDAFLVFDADNLLMPDYVRSINRLCADGYKAFCGYRNTKNFGTNWLTSGYGLIFLHDCVHMNRSRMALGGSCLVSGTGFGFTRQLIEQIGGWDFFTLTEDTQFSFWCASHGVRIGYCQEAMLFDEQPTTFAQSWRQRTRWVQGSFQVAVRHGGDLVHGICMGGALGYSCFEFMTMSLWGYGLAALSALTGLLCVFLDQGWLAGLYALGWSLLGAYQSLFLIGVLTLLSQWRKIRATKLEKLCSVVTFPVFMLSFVPIALAAPFQKFHWKPIHHNVAVSAESLMKK